MVCPAGDVIGLMDAVVVPAYAVIRNPEPPIVVPLLQLGPGGRVHFWESGLNMLLIEKRWSGSVRIDIGEAIKDVKHVRLVLGVVQ